MTKTKVVVCVSGGCVQGIFTDNQGTEFFLVDYDNLDADPNEPCDITFPTHSLNTFRSMILDEGAPPPGVANLIARLDA